jgi:hypothetical protein
MKLKCCVALATFSIANAHLAEARSFDKRDLAMFQQWTSTNSGSIERYRSYLAEQGVGDVVPMHELLRTASDWNTQACKKVHAQAFEVPPESTWAAMAKTLKLVAHLRHNALIGDLEVVSAYRNRKINECAGSGGTRHPKNAALDLVPIDGKTSIEAVKPLCAFHRKHGASWKMGLSLYPTGRIHIDADGYRTWGASGHRDTSVCLR